ncbi:MAG: hypothetical protein LBF78_07550 [Treponema sp.]|jgi:hypothetical protein|nr:hypothetical protein [Treponema sp.]
MDGGAGWSGVAIAAAQLASSTIIGNEANKLAAQELEVSRNQFELSKKEVALNAVDTLRTYDKDIAQLKGDYAQLGIDIRDTQTQISSYDKWLSNYSAQYAQEVQSKQAQTDALTASGKDSYDAFMNAIGYQDALAGASGRKGGGTSVGAVTQGIDQKLVDYVGADRTLDQNGGLFGSQLTAANMEMEQLKVDLGFQYQEAIMNQANLAQSLGELQSAQATTKTSIENAQASQDSLAEFIRRNFGDAYTDLYYGKSPDIELGIGKAGDYYITGAGQPMADSPMTGVVPKGGSSTLITGNSGGLMFNNPHLAL